MPKHDTAVPKQDREWAGKNLRYMALGALIGLPIVAGIFHFTVPIIVYSILGGVVLGADELKKLAPWGK